jgi:hypothetical protein
MGLVFTDVKVSVDSTVLFHPPKGDVWEHYEKAGQWFKKYARDLAPPRRSSARWGTWATGRMQASIQASVGAIAAKVIEVDCYTTSPHALYVLRGTAAQGRRFIYTTHGWANKSAVDSWIKQGGAHLQFEKDYTGFTMPVSRVPFVKIPIVLRVKGQRPNPFLQDAYTLMRRKYKELPRIDFDRTGTAAEPSPPIARFPG